MLTLLVMLAPLTIRPDDRAERAVAWEPEYKAVEARRKRESPPPDAPLFLGSSSIRLWDTAKAFPDLKPYNAGFGGSQVRDVTHALPRLAPETRPKFAVIYAGDNDLAAERSPETVRDDTAELLAKLREKYPKLPVLLIAVKPAPSRTRWLAAQTRANALLKSLAEDDPHAEYLDVATPMMADAKAVRGELFLLDRLHLNADGYALWNQLLTGRLKTWLPRP